MNAYVLKKISLLKNKYFMNRLLLAGVEVNCFNSELGSTHRNGVLLVTNQEYNLKKWIPKWSRRFIKKS